VSGTRVPFDLSLPFIVACDELPCGTRRFKRGDAFPWREVGFDELALLQLWLHHKVDAVVPHAVAHAVIPGPHVDVDVETPTQQRRRRGRDR